MSDFVDEETDMDWTRSELKPVIQTIAAVATPASNDPLPIARMIIQVEFEALVHWQGTFLEWRDGAYTETAGDAVRTSAYRYLEKIGEKPTRKTVTDAVDAMVAVAYLPAETGAGCWLDDQDRDTRDLLPLTNGILDLATGVLSEPSTKLFTLHALPVSYGHNSEPVEWLRFLGTIWSDDQESIDTLQEIFGYMLTGWTSLQKIFLVVGPKRAGKGTIFRILTALLGRSNVAAPTLSSLSQNFGMQSLIGKLAALVSDARLGGKADQTAIAERLLSISGEDHIGIPRKFLADYTAQVSARFFLATNELPRLMDTSGALASRFVMLVLTQSFYGKEDVHLTDRLLAELPQILNWSIEGRQRLKGRGRFLQPGSGLEAIEMLQELGSPIGAFLSAECEIGPGLSVDVDDLYKSWREWCEASGRTRPGTKDTFGRDLLSAAPMVHKRRTRNGDKRVHVYSGISLVIPGHTRSDFGHTNDSLEATKDVASEGGHTRSYHNDTYAHVRTQERSAEVVWTGMTSVTTCPRCAGEGDCKWCGK